MTRPDRVYLEIAVRNAAREAIWWATCRHEQGPKRNILLFASRRGGSTFAMELIGANRGIRTLDQPFSTVSRSITSGQAAAIPRFNQGQLTSVDAVVAARLDEMMERIFAGRLVINAPTKLWRRAVVFRSDRLVLKITDAKPIIGWFDEHVDAEIVYLTRHPVPQALSCLRNGWNLTVDAHLRDQRFVEAYLDDGSFAAAHDVMSTGSMLEQFVLNWLLENAAPLTLLPQRPRWTHVRYEDCVARPGDVLERLSDRLDLDDLDRMRDVVNRPSVSSHISTDSTRRAIAEGRAVDSLNSWRDRLDATEWQRCRRLMDRFGYDPEIAAAP
jgi:hypothetical protein